MDCVPCASTFSIASFTCPALEMLHTFLEGLGLLPNDFRRVEQFWIPASVVALRVPACLPGAGVYHQPAKRVLSLSLRRNSFICLLYGEARVSITYRCFYVRQVLVIACAQDCRGSVLDSDSASAIFCAAREVERILHFVPSRSAGFATPAKEGVFPAPADTRPRHLNIESRPCEELCFDRYALALAQMMDEDFRFLPRFEASLNAGYSFSPPPPPPSLSHHLEVLLP